MASYQVMTWHGIPAQVKAIDTDGSIASVQLPQSFQQEIDRVAMAEGLTDSDAYLDGWEWSEARQREGSADEVAAAVAAEIVEKRRGSGRASGG